MQSVFPGSNVLILTLIILTTSLYVHGNKTLDNSDNPVRLGRVERNDSQHTSGDNTSTTHAPEEAHGHGGGLHVAGFNYHEVRDPLIFTLVVLLASLCKLGYHHANILSSTIPESCILIILGVVFGAIIHFSGLSNNLPEFFKPHEFFVYLLPPIILEASFSLHDRTFTENLGSILLFAVVGTILAALFLGLSLFGLLKAGAMGNDSVVTDLDFIKIMVFSSLIVAVDPVAVLAVFNEIGVNHVLYFLVFGESLLNDGVTVVLYKVFQAYNVMDEISGVHIVLGIVKFFVVCFGGLLIGVLAGMASALLTKYSVHVKVSQPMIIYTMAYLGFLLAELFEFSGIISIIGCGLTQRRYAFNNISEKSTTTIKYFTKVISTTCEIIIFLFLGLSTVNDKHIWHTGFTLWTMALITLYRFAITFGISCALNKLDKTRVRKIGFSEQFMIAYGGLRGAVCFSLVAMLSPVEFPAKHMFITTTIFVILITVFLQGITIKPLMVWLEISLAPEKCRSMHRVLQDHITDHLMTGVEDIIGDHGKNHLREKLELLDQTYIQPILMLEPDPRDVKIAEFYENLILKEHYKYLKLSGAKNADDLPSLPHVNTESVINNLMTAPFTGMGQPMSPLPHPVAAPEFQTPDVSVEMGEVKMRRPSRVMRALSSVPSPETEIDAKALTGLLLWQRSGRLALSKYDKNLTSHHDMGEEVWKKSHRNVRLQSMISQNPPVVRQRTWSESDTSLGANRPAKPKYVRHAQTVDLLSAGDLDSTLNPNNTKSPVTLGSVFEENEDDLTSETQPMLEKIPEKSHKCRLERQIAMTKDKGAESPAIFQDEKESVAFSLISGGGKTDESYIDGNDDDDDDSKHLVRQEEMSSLPLDEIKTNQQEPDTSKDNTTNL